MIFPANFEFALEDIVKKTRVKNANSKFAEKAKKSDKLNSGIGSSRGKSC